MFNGGLKEKGEVRLDDIEPQHFRKMLEFIYSDNTKLDNMESALSVCYAADKYMINNLVLMCIDFIKENLNADNVYRTLKFARLINNADLEAESLQYLQTNTIDVLNSSSFPNAEKAFLLTILNYDDLCITSEVDLFSACIRWSEAQLNDDQVPLREVLGPEVLGLIRFLNMSVQEFGTIVIPSKLLQLQEEKDILYRIVTGTGCMPQGFNTNMESRVLFGTREIIEIEGDDSSIREAMNSLFLRVNVESYIFGLQLCGLFDRENAVQESFGVKLLINSDLVASAKFESEVSSGEKFEVIFSKPVLLKTNTDYTLQVTYGNSYTYYSKSNLHQWLPYFTIDGVEMNVKFSNTTISHICFAKKIK